MTETINDRLLGSQQICKKLSISRSTLERLRQPVLRDEFSNMLPFPPPTALFGLGPRWSVAVLNTWLQAVRQQQMAVVVSTIAE